MKRLHPLSVLLLALWLSTAAILVPQIVLLGVVLLLSMLFRGLLCGCALKHWLRQFIRLLPLFAAILLIQVLFVKEGRLLWGQNWYAVHSTGLQNGLAFCLRLLILFWSAQLLLRLSFEDFDLAFHTLRLPEELGFMVFYTIHVIPAASREIKNSLLLLRLRAIALRKLKLRQKLLVYNRISLSVIASVLSRSAIQATALDLRGFRSSGKRSHLNQLRFGLSDAFLLSLTLILTALYIIC
jgi:energy-coupling factor transport system permease protein